MARPAPPPTDTTAQSAATQRVDAFVDASFAFAVTLLVIGGGSGVPSSLDELRSALMGIPAFAAGFALIALFWVSHREFGRLSPRRDPLSIVLSLAIVFTVLIYVYPLRLLMSSFAYWVSGGRTPGEGLVRSWSDLQTLYVVYGLGYGLLALLFFILFRHGRRIAVSDEEVARADDWMWVYGAVASVAVLSLLSCLFAIQIRAPWLPGAIYGLIPLFIHGRRFIHKAPHPLAPKTRRAPRPTGAVRKPKR